MATAAHVEVQGLLRFLTQDAKIPLATALPKIGSLRKEGLKTPDAIAKADPTVLKSIFDDEEKIIKQVANAAKRVSSPRKRPASQSDASVAKRSKHDAPDQQDTERDLCLPTSDATVEELREVVIETNRAPFFLAFAVSVLKHTMPNQPLSSRLSLAQAIVSINSQSKAKSIGLTPGQTVADEGWADGQPKIKVLSREVPVMRRQYAIPSAPVDSQETIRVEGSSSHDALWGLDLEALKKSNSPLVAGKSAGSSGLPIYRPQAPRAYLLKSMSVVRAETNQDGSQTANAKKPKPAEIIAAKEKAAAMVLRALDMLCESWIPIISKEELDKRAWSWYVSTRPEVQQGQAGWGQRGTVRLADILNLCRKS